MVPDKLKVARISPIYKGGGATDVSNYRPISLLCNFAKILEKIVHTRLTKFIVDNNLLSNVQFGFRAGRSTVHPAALIHNIITESLNKKKHVAAIFCDLSKAFDTCNHDILLKMLEKKGIQGIELAWFKSYLTERKQYVSLDAHDSLPALIKLGVPQGSVLGPLLFIIYMDELPRSIETPVYLFADDTVLLACDDNLNNLITKINHEFKKLCLYFRKFRLSLNPKKTQYMIFSNSPEVHAANVQVFINNNNDGENFAENMHEIKRIKPDDENPTYKYLGIYMDPNFTFKHHVEKILSKLSRALFMLRQFKNFLPEKSLKLLYYTLFHCHLIYAAEVWTSASESLLNKLFLKQKAAIRIITNSKYNAHTQPLFKKLEILPLHDLYRYQRMIFFQAIIQKKAQQILTIFGQLIEKEECLIGKMTVN